MDAVSHFFLFFFLMSSIRYQSAMSPEGRRRRSAWGESYTSEGASPRRCFKIALLWEKCSCKSVYNQSGRFKNIFLEIDWMMEGSGGSNGKCLKGEKFLLGDLVCEFQFWLCAIAFYLASNKVYFSQVDGLVQGPNPGFLKKPQYTIGHSGGIPVQSSAEI